MVRLRRVLGQVSWSIVEFWGPWATPWLPKTAPNQLVRQPHRHAPLFSPASPQSQPVSHWPAPSLAHDEAKPPFRFAAELLPGPYSPVPLFFQKPSRPSQAEQTLLTIYVDQHGIYGECWCWTCHCSPLLTLPISTTVREGRAQLAWGRVVVGSIILSELHIWAI